MTTKNYEVVSPLPKHKPSWNFVPNDEIVARLVKCPNDIVQTTYNGIKCEIHRLPDGLYRIKMAGRYFTVDKVQLRQFTMTR